jgi:thiol-disulfide isomerase/thioredoxin
MISALPCAASLKVGDPAPKIQPGSWAQGEPVKELEGDKVYIVEFWATWCGPCVAAIPHINDLYKKHKDKGLVVVGQNLGEDAKTVKDFVKQMGSKMTYRVTVDTPEGTMGKKWLEAAGQNGIPCAFVVSKKGKIAYIGHPMSMEESLLEKLLAEPSTKAAGSSAKPAADASSAPSAKAIELSAKAAELIRAGKLDEAEAAIAELQEQLTDNHRQIGGLLELDLLLARKQTDDAIQLANLLAEDFAGKPEVVAAVAMHLVAAADAPPALQTEAEKLAKPISETDGAGRCGAFSALAKVAFLRGNKEAAVDLQTKAVGAASPAQAAAAQAALDAYKAP